MTADLPMDLLSFIILLKKIKSSNNISHDELFFLTASFRAYRPLVSVQDRDTKQ